MQNDWQVFALRVPHAEDRKKLTQTAEQLQEMDAKLAVKHRPKTNEP
jgi:hypothetical protein